MAAKDSLNKDQMVRVIHLSDERNPPHSQDHFMKDIYEQGDGDRRFSNDVIFAGEAASSNELMKDIGREYLHSYDVPKRLFSEEMFGDDDHPHESPGFVKDKQPELWHDVRASREDAITNNRVVRFVNAREAPGSTGYILPKGMIKSGGIKYQGVKYVGADPTKWEA